MTGWDIIIILMLMLVMFIIYSIIYYFIIIIPLNKRLSKIEKFESKFSEPEKIIKSLGIEKRIKNLEDTITNKAQGEQETLSDKDKTFIIKLIIEYSQSIVLKCREEMNKLEEMPENINSGQVTESHEFV